MGTVDSSTAISKSKPGRFEICGNQGMIVVEEDRIVLAEGVMLEADREMAEYNGNSNPKDIGLGLHTKNYRNIPLILKVH